MPLPPGVDGSDGSPWHTPCVIATRDEVGRAEVSLNGVANESHFDLIDCLAVAWRWWRLLLRWPGCRRWDRRVASDYFDCMGCFWKPTLSLAVKTQSYEKSTGRFGLYSRIGQSTGSPSRSPVPTHRLPRSDHPCAGASPLGSEIAAVRSSPVNVSPIWA